MSELLAPPKGDLGDIPALRPHPGAAGFRRRADRLAELAPGHPAGDFLALMGRLAAAQADAVAAFRPAPGPDDGGTHPLDSSRAPAGWRDVLVRLLGALSNAPMPPEAREAVAALSRREAGELEALAARVLGGELAEADLAAAPFVGAALQVVFAARAAAIPAEAVPRAQDAACPVCAAPPVVGVVLPEDKLRYQVCSLCGSWWHHTRLQCVLCRSAAKVGYLSLEGHGSASPPAAATLGAARAETCDACEVYTKLLYQEQAPGLEPFADDLASIALDVLVGERGYVRVGRNPYLAIAGG